MWNIPNILTSLRVFLVPVFVTVYFLDWQWAHQCAAFILFLAAVTDYLDGYLARKLGQMTPFGAFLDPVADKLIVAAALLLICHSYHDPIITIPAVILLLREIFISSLREWLGSRGLSATAKVSFVGKLKTTAQLMALVGIVSDLEVFMGFPIYWVTLGTGMLYVATLLSVWSMVSYVRAAWPHLRSA